MKLYHGTGAYNLDGFIKEGVKLKRRNGFKRPSFCASLSLEEAGFFALRKTPANDLTKTGVVLEFEARGMVERKDFIHYCDRVLRDEQEIVVFTLDKLALIAYYTFNRDRGNNWVRRELPVQVREAEG